jgi:hypothetical protein
MVLSGCGEGTNEVDSDVSESSSTISKITDENSITVGLKLPTSLNPSEDLSIIQSTSVSKGNWWESSSQLSAISDAAQPVTAGLYIFNHGTTLWEFNEGLSQKLSLNVETSETAASQTILEFNFGDADLTNLFVLLEVNLGSHQFYFVLGSHEDAMSTSVDLTSQVSQLRAMFQSAVILFSIQDAAGTTEGKELENLEFLEHMRQVIAEEDFSLTIETENSLIGSLDEIVSFAAVVLNARSDIQLLSLRLLERFSNLFVKTVESDSIVPDVTPTPIVEPIFYSIGGSVSGLVGTIVLNLVGLVAPLSLTSDGSFTFSKKLSNGATYSVDILSQPNSVFCTLKNESAIIVSKNITNIEVNCLSTNPFLSSLIPSPGSLDIPFEFYTDNYSVALLYLQSFLTFTPTSVVPNAYIEVNGSNIISGQTSSQLSMNEGVNLVPIEVTAPSNTEDITYTITVNRGAFAQTAYLKPAFRDASIQYGNSVDVDGTTSVVGAFKEDSNAQGVGFTPGNGAASSGAVGVYTQNEVGFWIEQVNIKGLNTEAGDQFGQSVAISGDILIVGANNEDSNTGAIDHPGPSSAGDNDSGNNNGAAYAFLRTAGVWAQEAYLKKGVSSAANFGASVDIDGSVAVVGAPGDNDSKGLAVVYRRVGVNDWQEDGTLNGSNSDTATDSVGTGDQFGYSVAISGTTIVVGARGEDSNLIEYTLGNPVDNDSAEDSGAVYVFVYDSVGNVWNQQGYLKAHNAETLDLYGSSVAISGDTIAVGSPREDNASAGIGPADANGASGSGAVYIYARSGNTWSRQAYIKASNPEANDGFGTSVAIDGDYLVVGATGEDSDVTGVTNGTPNEASVNNNAANSGAVYLFKRTNGEWAQVKYFKGDNSGAGTNWGDQFGISAAISGTNVIVGANGEDANQNAITSGGSGDDGSTESGAAYSFR